jgi:predicted AAA+ superfamily ATPase
MAGRIKLFELFPLMFTELIDPEGKNKNPTKLEELLKAGDIDDLFRNDVSVLLGSEWELVKNTEEWLIKWGGMPALIHIKDESERINWIKDYIYTYLERDLSDLARLTDLRPFKRFQSIASLRAGNLLQYSELARDSSTSIETARRYLEYLNISYQNFLLQPYYKNLTSSLVKTPKLYWIDNGLLRQTSGLGFNVDSGQLYENYFASELMKFIKTDKNAAKLFYYRTRSGMEIDFIIETEQGIIALEVKNREKVTKSDFTAIRKIKTAAKDQFIGGIVVYRGNKIKQFDKQLWAIPSGRLLR